MCRPQVESNHHAGRVAISPVTTKKPKLSPRKTPSRSPEANKIGRQLASLAVTRTEQGGQLSVRQSEQLRRALAMAAESLEWEMLAANSDEPVKKATEEVTKLAKIGTKALGQDLADELADKKTEIIRLKKLAGSIHKLSAKDEFDEPIEVSYDHTARDGSQGYVTKTQTVTITTAREATDAAEAIEKKLEAWDKLREQMLIDIKRKQRQLEEIQAGITNFVDSAKTLLLEVFATLH